MGARDHGFMIESQYREIVRVHGASRDSTPVVRSGVGLKPPPRAPNASIFLVLFTDLLGSALLS